MAGRIEQHPPPLGVRLAVTERTVRRDIARLRELGYGVESDPGPWGGYRLRSGERLPKEQRGPEG